MLYFRVTVEVALVTYGLPRDLLNFQNPVGLRNTLFIIRFNMQQKNATAPHFDDTFRPRGKH